jgi:transposase
MLATKAIVTAYFVDGKSYAAIGREFGISRSSAYNRIARFFDICPLLK